MRGRRRQRSESCSPPGRTDQRPGRYRGGWVYLGRRSRMPLATSSQLVRTLRVLLVLSVVGPAVLFALAAINDYLRLYQQAHELVRKNVDILHEHALKVLETQELVVDRLNAMLRGYDRETIAGSEEMHA